MGFSELLVLLIIACLLFPWGVGSHPENRTVRGRRAG
jgi:hypothetical protein